MERVVVTGAGLTSALGNDPQTFWENLAGGKSGIGPIERFDAGPTGISVASEIKDFPFDKYLVHKDSKRMDRFSWYGIYAGLEALADSGIDLEREDPYRIGVMLGSGIGGLSTLQEQIIKMHIKGPQRISPLFVPMAIANMAAGNLALRVGAKGICTATVTACASATHSIGEAFRNIKFGYSDAILAGGTEAPIDEIGIGGFSALTALTRESDPAKASIPFDEARSGFVIGEGAGVLVLESLTHALARNAEILGEVVGYGATCDAHHMTTPDPTGESAAMAMKAAITEAGISPKAIDYVNAHGTSTPANDVAETEAILQALGEESQTLISSTKGATGHLLGAAGAIEAIACLKALETQFAPGTINTQHLDPKIRANVLIGSGEAAAMQYALSNSLGFGGHNGVLCFKRWEETNEF